MASETTITGPFDDQLAARLLHQRIVVLGQEVDDPIANRICAELLLLSAEDQRRDISLYINSPGGSVSAGLAIYDTMRLIPNDVSTLAMGIAASMGQFLLSAGTPGKRFALPHARILMHQGSAGIRGTAVDVADPGREPGAHQVGDDAADRRAHRPGPRDDRPGRRPGPLVHRRTGAGLRLRRPGPGVGRRHPARRRPPPHRTGRDHGPLHRADRGREDPAGERVVDVYSRLLSDRIIYLGTEIDDDVANVHGRPTALPGVGQSRSRDRPVHQLSRRLDVGDDRDLRHHAVRPRAGGHHLRRPGRLRGGGAPGRRRAGRCASCCRTPGCCCTSRRRAGRARFPISPCRPRSCSGSASRWSRCSAGTPGRTSPRCARTPTGTRSSPRSRPSPTGWPITSSARGCLAGVSGG